MTTCMTTWYAIDACSFRMTMWYAIDAYTFQELLTRPQNTGILGLLNKEWSHQCLLF